MVRFYVFLIASAIIEMFDLFIFVFIYLFIYFKDGQFCKSASLPAS